MSNELLKSSSHAPTNDDSNGDESVNPCNSPCRNNEASISKVVQEVVRSVCRERTAMKPFQTSKSQWIDDCVESVIRSNANNRLTKSQSFLEDKDIDEHLAENGDQEMDDMDTPPKLTAINDEKHSFDQYRYRRRRKRRFFSGVRRQTRRYPVKLRPITDMTDETEPPPRRKRPKSSHKLADASPAPQIKTEEEISMEAQVHDSVFSPDQCNLMKSRKNRHHVNCNGSVPPTVPMCWHSSLNEKLFPHFRLFKNGDLSQANKWSIETVTEFVRALPACPAGVAEKFRQDQIDGEAFLLLTQHDIVRLMNIRLGPAVKIHNAIMFLKHERLNHSKSTGTE